MKAPFTADKEKAWNQVTAKSKSGLGIAHDVVNDLNAINTIQNAAGKPVEGLDAIKRRAADNARRANGQLPPSPPPGIVK